MTDTPAELYNRHIQAVGTRWDEALESSGFDSALVMAGAETPYFLDDQAAAFRINPHLAQWFPHNHCPGSALLVRKGERPTLHFFQPADYWHAPPAVPEWLGDALSVQMHTDAEHVVSEALKQTRPTDNIALIGPDPEANLSGEQHNPAPLIARLNYQRARKTEFEVWCMTEATRAAVAGHIAARDRFLDTNQDPHPLGTATEFDLLNAFLQGSSQVATDTPYNSIVALNDHGAVLHYQHYDRAAPEASRSFLIDAGARFRCYASDITRSYVRESGSAAGALFASLIDRLNTEQQALCDALKPGRAYPDFHQDMHVRLGHILCDHGILTCTPETAFELGLTETFLPHGLGHLLGIQTHDVGGQQSSPEGGLTPPPARYPALRFTRPVEVDQVFTIEPGLYFIPMLLDQLRVSAHRDHVDWSTVDSLVPYGGIRIEDNVRILSDGVQNLTRDAFTAAGHPGA